MKYLLWLAIGAAVFYWITRAGRNTRGSVGRGPTPGATASPASPARARPNAGKEVEEMLPCVHCGVHIPASEAILAGPGRSYCSQTHRLLHEQG